MTVHNNVLALDVDKDFIQPFCKKNRGDKPRHATRYIGLGKFIDALVSFSIYTEDPKVIALKNRVIAGAGLDVFENEPAITPGLVELDNVVCLPHIGSASGATRAKMSELAATNLLAVLKGERPPTPVNLEALD